MTDVTVEALENLLASNNKQDLTQLLEKEHPADLAQVLCELEIPDIWKLLALLPIDKQANLFGYFSHDVQLELAQPNKRARIAKIITEMDSDDRADFFNGLSETQKRVLLPALAQVERMDLLRLASYEEGTAGAIMTSDYATLNKDLTASQALKKLREEAPDKETIYRSYVVDRSRRLIGTVSLKDIIIASPRAKITDIMDSNTHAIQVNAEQEDVARTIAKYDMLAIPVIDDNNRLVGIVTHDDAADVLTEEATEDIHKGGTVNNLSSSVREASIFMLYRARIFWLIILVFGNIFSGAGIAAFEETIAAYVSLLFFLPLLIASGGNAGAQSGTLMVRALATGDVRTSDWGKMFGREILISMLLGITMAIAVSSIGVWRGGVDVAIVVSLSMVLIVIVGSLIGLLLPFVLTKLKLDPATASAPLITSIADLAGVLLYFSIADYFLIK